MDFGKFKYEREKGDRERSKKQHNVEVKRVRIGFMTGKHDLELRAEQVQKFLERGDKVFIGMQLRGREKALGTTAMQKFNAFLQMIPIPIQIESPPKRIPQGIHAVITKK